MSDFQDEVMFSLIDQVRKATPETGNEQGVTTFISRPLWEIWCEAVGLEKNCEPSEWNLPSDGPCNRVYGSETIILERKDYIAYSRVNYNI